VSWKLRFAIDRAFRADPIQAVVTLHAGRLDRVDGSSAASKHQAFDLRRSIW